MRADRGIGLAIVDGEEVGRDPRRMRAEELHSLGHGAPLLRAVRNKCVDCCAGQLAEVRKCVAVRCPLWPFRMGSNPWHRRQARKLGLREVNVAPPPAAHTIGLRPLPASDIGFAKADFERAFGSGIGRSEAVAWGEPVEA